MYLFYIVEKVKYITAIEHLGLFKVENFPCRPTIRQHFSRYFWPPQIKLNNLGPSSFHEVLNTTGEKYFQASQFLKFVSRVFQ